MHIKLNLIIILLFTLGACKPPVVEEPRIQVKVPVKIIELSHGTVRDELTFFANTQYLKRNVVSSPIPSFITSVSVKLGDPVKEGQILYTLETKERRALGSEAVMPDSTTTSFGRITIKAPASGIISTLDKQQIGDYVLEGAQLCTISESNALAFAVNVPFEYSSYAKTGMNCMIVLPDDSRYMAKFITPLSTMNALAQTQTILAKSVDRMVLPENLIVKVVVNKNTGGNQQVLPKEAVLSDEMMENFWVMKLLNDSMAIKVIITPGAMSAESITITSPLFKPNDKFLISGNYGLPDTAVVKVVH